MKTRKIYILFVVLGLAMVWLSALFTFELTKAQQQPISLDQVAVTITDNLQPMEEQTQAAGFNRGDAVMQAGTGFPLLLAGLGLVFVVGGATRCRRYT